MREPLKADELSRLIEVPTSTGSILVSCKVERSRQARNLKLCVNSATEAVLKIPMRCSLKYANDFLMQQGDWLVRAMESVPKKQFLADYFDQEPTISALGRDYRVILNFTNSKPSITFFPESRDLCIRFDPGKPEDELLKLLVKFARKVIAKRVGDLSERIGVEVGRISIRDQNTRWGSCSGSRGISLNWRLILLNAELHDHVIFHELAHLTEMNHSRRFWELLENYDPKSKTNDKDINKIQKRIMALGR
jgi:predicted metal-dependent hydrolase